MRIKPCLSKSNFLLYKRRQLKSILLATFGLIFSLVFILPAKSESTLDTQYSSNYPQSQSVNISSYAFTNTEQLLQSGKNFYQSGQYAQAVQSFRILIIQIDAGCQHPTYLIL